MREDGTRLGEGTKNITKQKKAPEEIMIAAED